MAEKSMKEIRDEVALEMVKVQLHDLLQHPELTIDRPAVCRIAFEWAEVFLAARYDADTSGLYKKPPR